MDVPEWADVLADPDAARTLPARYEAALADRDRTGTFYTPRPIVDWMLDRVLPRATSDPRTTPLPSVLDPACGSGNVLAAVVERWVADGVPPRQAVAAVHGVDTDPAAVRLCRMLCALAAPGTRPDDVDVRVGDGLDVHPAAPVDVVVGNPPFLGRLKTRTSTVATGGLGAYTDASAVFLHHALGLVRPGGVVALVQPLSLLAARDAGPVRAAVAAAGALTDLRVLDRGAFPDASVVTCVPVVRTGLPQRDVWVWFDGEHPEPRPLPEAEWGPLAVRGVPAVAPAVDGVLRDVATCTADFRDQYYGLVGHVSDAPPSAHRPPLVTSGLIDPARCRWGEVSTRFAKERYAAPVVDLAGLPAPLRAWSRARLVPKVLVATQGRVVEAVADPEGALLPSVPVITVVPRGEVDVWHLLAVLCAPPVAALAATRFHGTALSPGAIKLSATQVAGLPLPVDRDAWRRGAVLARKAQETGDRGALLACAEEMGRAYREERGLAWWTGRLPA